MKAQQAVEESGVNGAVFRGPLDHYSGLIRDGTLREDEHQKAVLQTLDQLHKTLRGYSNTPTSFFSKVEREMSQCLLMFFKLTCLLKLRLKKAHPSMYPSWNTKATQTS